MLSFAVSEEKTIAGLVLRYVDRNFNFNTTVTLYKDHQYVLCIWGKSTGTPNVFYQTDSNTSYFYNSFYTSPSPTPISLNGDFGKSYHIWGYTTLIEEAGVLEPFPIFYTIIIGTGCYLALKGEKDDTDNNL